MSRRNKRQRPSLKRTVFLAVFTECGNVADAARLAKCARQSHYGWLADPEYAEAFAAAREEACDNLKSECRRRAVEGVPEPVYYKGKVCGTERVYSDKLLMFLIKGMNPEYRDNWQGPPAEPGLPRRPKLDLSRLTEEEQERLRELACKAAGIARDP